MLSKFQNSSINKKPLDQTFSFSKSFFERSDSVFSVDDFLSQDKFLKFQLNGEIKGFIITSLGSINNESRENFKKLISDEFLYGMNAYFTQYLEKLEQNHDLFTSIIQASSLNMAQVSELIYSIDSFQIKDHLLMSSYQNKLPIYCLGKLYV